MTNLFQDQEQEDKFFDLAWRIVEWHIAAYPSDRQLHSLIKNTMCSWIENRDINNILFVLDQLVVNPAPATADIELPPLMSQRPKPKIRFQVQQQVEQEIEYSPATPAFLRPNEMSAAEKKELWSTAGYKKLMFLCAGVAATALQRSDPMFLSTSSGLPLEDIIRVMADKEWRDICTMVSNRFAHRVLPNKVDRIVGIQAEIEALERIFYERGLLATTHEEISDDALLQMGLNPSKRDLELARVPGGRTGRIIKVPVTIRITGEGENRGPRTQTVYEFRTDHETLNALHRLREQLSKEMNDKQEKVNLVAKELKGVDESLI